MLLTFALFSFIERINSSILEGGITIFCFSLLQTAKIAKNSSKTIIVNKVLCGIVLASFLSNLFLVAYILCP